MSTPFAKATQSSLAAAVDALRAPIQAFPAESDAAHRLKITMLGLADRLVDLHQQGDGDTLEAEIVWTALFSFPTLVVPGPKPEEMVSSLREGALADEETASTLSLLARLRGALTAFDPPGFTAALWRATLLSIYRLVELFVLLDDERGIESCFELLDTAEEIAGRLDPATRQAA